MSEQITMEVGVKKRKVLMIAGDSYYRVKPEHRRKYERICQQMQTLLDNIIEYEPEANLYLEDSGNWCLMVGDSHKNGDKPQQHLMACHCSVMPSEGGGW